MFLLGILESNDSRFGFLIGHFNFQLGKRHASAVLSNSSVPPGERQAVPLARDCRTASNHSGISSYSDDIRPNAHAR
jgi:hypothetical protein